MPQISPLERKQLLTCNTAGNKGLHTASS